VQNQHMTHKRRYLLVVDSFGKRGGGGVMMMMLMMMTVLVFFLHKTCSLSRKFGVSLVVCLAVSECSVTSLKAWCNHLSPGMGCPFSTGIH